MHMLKGKRSSAGFFREMRRVNPFREWIAGLCLALAVILIGGVYALQIFVAGYTDTSAEGTVTGDTVHYDTRKVEQVLEVYKTRKENAERFESETVALPPPLVEPTTQEDASEAEPPVAQKPDVQVE